MKTQGALSVAQFQLFYIDEVGTEVMDIEVGGVVVSEVTGGSFNICGPVYCRYHGAARGALLSVILVHQGTGKRTQALLSWGMDGKRMRIFGLSLETGRVNRYLFDQSYE